MPRRRSPAWLVVCSRHGRGRSGRRWECRGGTWSLSDDQPMQHEIGNRTYIVADVEPLDLDGVRTIEVGTALWLLGFVALLPFYGRLEDDGRLGGCGPAWPASGSACSAWSTAAAAARPAPSVDADGARPSRRPTLLGSWPAPATDGYGEHFAAWLFEQRGRRRARPAWPTRSSAGSARMLDARRPAWAGSAPRCSAAGTTWSPPSRIPALGDAVAGDVRRPAGAHRIVALALARRLEPFDLVVVVGNVIVDLAEGTERAVLARLRRAAGAWPASSPTSGFRPERWSRSQPDLPGRRVRPLLRRRAGSTVELAVRQLRAALADGDVRRVGAARDRRTPGRRALRSSRSRRR